MGTKKSTHCIGCGREHKDQTLRKLQDVNRQNLRSHKRVGDIVRLTSKWGIEEKGTEGIISRIKDGKARVTFNYQTPFSLELYKEYGKLSVSGGTVKEIPITDLESTTETERVYLHKHQPNGIEETPTVMTISQVWEYDR